MEGRKLNLTLICFAFLLYLSFKQIITKAQLSPTYVGDDCNYSREQPLNNAYQKNLNGMLSYLSNDSATSKGYNYTRIGDNTTKGDAVYGLYDCRGDIVGYFCEFCVSSASREVLGRCPNRVSATIFYSFCIFRYSNENFFGKVTTDPSWQHLGTKNVSSSIEIQKGDDFMKSLIRKATIETNQLYYMDGFNLSSTESRYGLVQCSRDLTNERCRQCLEFMLAKVRTCCEHKLGWQVSSASCLIRYDDNMFYLHNQSPSVLVPDPQTGNASVTYRACLLMVFPISIFTDELNIERKKN
ncbi:hypothetical protein TSUD_366780 [Trifolium subterraneum]|uniref:Gnk2-homologous domain-containing protein n=1 Tax=Trifolium subterraneum TaxID=3900 RepID=A0A2Z6MQM6_TRISU|nr:hypothetical protein TSUD_366780 [Trifolium subterraneum]